MMNILKAIFIFILFSSHARTQDVNFALTNESAPGASDGAVEVVITPGTLSLYTYFLYDYDLNLLEECNSPLLQHICIPGRYIQY